MKVRGSKTKAPVPSRKGLKALRFGGLDAHGGVKRESVTLCGQGIEVEGVTGDRSGTARYRSRA